jgi:hypothetical protein
MTNSYFAPPNATVLDFDISDSTARIKAERFMASLQSYANPDNFRQLNQQFGIRGDRTPTSVWKSIINIGLKREDVFALLEGRKSESQIPEMNKAIKAVHVFAMIGENNPEIGLWLIRMSYKRSKILKPQPGERIGSPSLLIKVTFHSLQRIFQRGYGLTKDGELSQFQLVKILFFVWREALQASIEQGISNGKLIVVTPQARFVVAIELMGENRVRVFHLVTVLPPH